MNYHRIKVAGIERDLPIVPISDKLSIAAFVIFGDTEIVEPCARALAEKLPKVDYLITAEAKSIPLIYEMAKVMKMPRYIIARKSIKGYMAHPIVTKVHSITTKDDQILCLDEEDAQRIKGKKVAIVDDVISTGASLAAIEQLVAEAGGTVAARAAILSEGDANERDDLIVLGKIPLFFRD
jgi:adenine phosphoribosyltransferase